LSTQSSKSSIRANNKTGGNDQTAAAKGWSQIEDQSDEAVFVGSAGSTVYHRLDCRFVAKIKNKVYYKSAEEAKKDGKVPCKVCNPP
jgi:methylphosphotriester-DNA--protein-cysteine methyltransferase